MRAITPVLMILAAATAPVAWSKAPTAPPPGQTTQADDDASDEDQLICERQAITGSRLSRKVVCSTKSDKDQNDAINDRALEQLNSLGGQQAPQGR